MDGQIEIPTFSDDDSPSYNFGDYTAANPFGASGFEAPSGFGASFGASASNSFSSSALSTSQNRPRTDSNVSSFNSSGTSSPRAALVPPRKGSFAANVSSQFQQHARSKSSQASSFGHKSSSSFDRNGVLFASGGPGKASPPPMMSALSYAQHGKRESATFTNGRAVTSDSSQSQSSGSQHAPLELALYIIMESFIEKAEEKIGDILSRPIVRSSLLSA